MTSKKRAPAEQKKPYLWLSSFLGASGLVVLASLVWLAEPRDVPLLVPGGDAKVAPEQVGGLNVPHRNRMVFTKLEPTQNIQSAEQGVENNEVSEESLTQEIPPPTAQDTAEAQSTTEVMEPETPSPSPQPQLAANEPETPPSPDTQPTAQAEPSPPPSETQRWYIQIAALKDPAAGQKLWNSYRKAIPHTLRDLDMHTEKTTNANGVLVHRIQIGPVTSRAQARAICAAMKKKKMSCFLVRPNPR